MKAVLFDMDGTLVDSEKLWDIALQQLYVRLGGVLTPQVRAATVGGSAEGDFVSMAVPSDGSYGVTEGVISSFPCTCDGGEWSIVEGLEINDFSRERIDASAAELVEERDAVAAMGLLG